MIDVTWLFVGFCITLAIFVVPLLSELLIHFVRLALALDRAGAPRIVIRNYPLELFIKLLVRTKTSYDASIEYSSCKKGYVIFHKDTIDGKYYFLEGPDTVWKTGIASTDIKVFDSIWEIGGTRVTDMFTIDSRKVWIPLAVCFVINTCCFMYQENPALLAYLACWLLPFLLALSAGFICRKMCSRYYTKTATLEKRLSDLEKKDVK